MCVTLYLNLPDNCTTGCDAEQEVSFVGCHAQSRCIEVVDNVTHAEEQHAPHCVTRFDLRGLNLGILHHLYLPSRFATMPFMPTQSGMLWELLWQCSRLAC